MAIRSSERLRYLIRARTLGRPACLVRASNYDACTEIAPLTTCVDEIASKLASVLHDRPV